LLSDGTRFRGEQHEVVEVQGTTTTLTTTVSTGVVAFVYSIDLAGVTGLTRYTNAWDEYRMLRCDFDIYPVVASTGICNFWYDEKSGATPTANEAQERDVNRVLITNSFKNNHTYQWVPRDITDILYTPSSSTTTVAYFKAFTNNTSWASTVVATAIFVVKPRFVIEWRGVKST